MKKSTAALCLLFALLLIAIPVSSLYAQWDPEGPGDEEALLVGRLAYIEGRVSQYIPDEDQWIPAEEDAPVGADDILQSGRDGRAELIIPNNTWIRMNNDTQMHLMSLRADLTGVAVDAGIVRFQNKGSDAIIRAATPFGSVSASSGSSFDLYVDDTSLEVVALKGKVSFVHTHGQEEYEVIAGSSSLVADRNHVTAGKRIFDRDWEAWNNHRDTFWRMRARRSSESRDYLPPPLSDDAYVLDSYGRWVRVYYDGAYRIFWRPLYIRMGWAPFTVGRWMMWHGDYCWLPGEPFGYVTHHYGNWVLVNNLWYWAPPVMGIRVRFGSPFLHIGFAWYPGRVGWIRSGLSIGWVPLAPYEPYYCRHRWGPRVIVVKNVHAKTIIVKKRRYRYARHTIIVTEKNHRRIHRKEKIRTSKKRKNRIAPSRKPFRRDLRKKPAPRRIMEVKRARKHRRTAVAKRYGGPFKAQTGRRHQGNLQGLPRQHAKDARLASAGSTTDQPIKKRAFRGKREHRRTAPLKFFRKPDEAKRPRLAVREKRAFHRKERRTKAQQALQVPRFSTKPAREKLDRIRSHPERRPVARARVDGKRRTRFRFAQRDDQPRSSTKASSWQR
ncbi:MAG: FecR domain-containing protein [Deltaproteobacteria bacterium]|nr:FecR domain-containing protein [Deltaproteobacteria bacterium]